MVCSTSKRFAIFIIIVALFSYHAWAQGPSPALYYDSGINLPWAECYAYQEGGSRLKLPFLSVVSSKFRCAPLGIGNYSRDVMVEVPVVFIGNGIIKENTWNSYRGRKRDYLTGNIDVSGKAVMFCYDFPDNIEKQIKNEFSLAKRIAEAASRNAAAVILFSSRQKAPFLTVNYDIESDIPEIPVITVTQKSALDLLLYDFDVDSKSLLSQWEESGQPPQSVELSAKIHLKIQGNFDKAETKNFLIRFRGAVFSKEEMEKTVIQHRSSMKVWGSIRRLLPQKRTRIIFEWYIFSKKINFILLKKWLTSILVLQV